VPDHNSRVTTSAAAQDTTDERTHALLYERLDRLADILRTLERETTRETKQGKRG
jgi:hypothetical protein